MFSKCIIEHAQPPSFLFSVNKMVLLGLPFLIDASAKFIAFVYLSYIIGNTPLHLTVPELIQHWGYPVEVHNVQTEDGYILGMHRIPQPGRPPVFLVHGVGSSSATWVYGPPKKSLGYLLADAGFDVWMGNTRGNTYSRKHVIFKACSFCDKFWNFGFDDTGIKDLSAEIDFILESTGFEKIHFVGHSMGGTQYAVLMSERPQYNDKIIEAYLLAPAVFMTHATTPIFRLSEHSKPIKDIMELIKGYEFLPPTSLISRIGKHFCNQQNHPFVEDICNNLAFALFGFNPDQLNTTMLPVYLDQQPSGTSTRPYVHYAQLHKSKKPMFKKFDFGSPTINQARYGSSEPPFYNLSNIKTPVALWTSDKDLLVDPQDVHLLSHVLPNVSHFEMVNITGFTHSDFTIGINADTAIYHPIIERMLKSLA